MLPSCFTNARLALVAAALLSSGTSAAQSSPFAALGRTQMQPLPGTLSTLRAESVVLSPGRKFALITDSAKKLSLWSLASGAKVRELSVRVDRNAGGFPIAFDGDELFLVGSDTASVEWLRDDGSLLDRVPACRSEAVQRVDGSVLGGLRNNSIRVIAKGAYAGVFATGCVDGRVSFWEGSRETMRFHPGAYAAGRMGARVSALTFNADGSFAAALIGRYAYLFAMRGSSARLLDSMLVDVDQHSGEIAFVSGGARLAVMRGREVQLWSLITRELERRLTLPSQGRALEVSPSGQYLAVTLSPGVQLWAVSGYEPLAHLRFDSPIARAWFAADERGLILQSFLGGLHHVSLASQEAAR